MALATAPSDVTQMSVEELLDAKVYTASKFEQKISEAPSSVTIVTADEIKAYGWRTLGELLKSVRGLYVSYDRNYAYLGVRGFNRPGDYNARILLLLDGHRLNEPVYDSFYIDHTFPVDLDLIERVEIVRGPGSSIYGSDAFFAVINVITKSGRSMPGAEAAAAIGSYDTNAQRLSDGGKRDGFEWLVSGSRYHSDGPDLYFPEFDSPATHHGVAAHLDGDRSGQLFARLSYSGYTLEAAYSRRVKQIPTASFGTVFGDPREFTADQYQLVNLSRTYRVGRHWDLSPHLFFGRYSYYATYPYAPPEGLNYDAALGEWWGAETRFAGHYVRHEWLLGVEYQDNFRKNQINYDVSPYVLYTDARHQDRSAGVYAQDQFRLAETWLLNVGLRYDNYSLFGGTFNPRVALIWNLRRDTDLKAIYGTAYLPPNDYELYYYTQGRHRNDLRPEKIATYELIADHFFDPDFRLTADLYYNRISNLIDTVGTDPVTGDAIFANVGRVHARGAELAAERRWPDGARVRLSGSWQLVRNTGSGAPLSDSPRWLAKVNVDRPWFGGLFRTGAEAQYVGKRLTPKGGAAAGSAVFNLNAVSRELFDGLEISAGIYNLFDLRYADPGRPEDTQDTIPQDGRNFRLKFTYRFHE